MGQAFVGLKSRNVAQFCSKTMDLATLRSVTMKQYVHVFPCLDNRVVKFDITLHKKVDKFMLALIAYILWLHFRNVGYFNIY